MPAFLIVIGSGIVAFLLLTFQQVPLLGCFASGLFTRQTRLFNTVINDPICFAPQFYYSALLLGVGIAGFGVFKAARQRGSAPVSNITAVSTPAASQNPSATMAGRTNNNLAMAKALFIAPAGKVVLLSDGRVLAQSGSGVQAFDSTDAFRSSVNDAVSVWYEVKDAPMRAHFARIFGSEIVPVA